MRCLLVGNYGVANMGDEALREYFLHAFPQIDWVVLSANPVLPNEISRLPGGIGSLFRTSWLRTLKQFKTCDAVVFGGGTLFTDVESTYACFLWWMHAAVARFYKKPVYLAFQGVGPFATKRGEVLARKTAQKSAFVSVRDEASMARVQKWQLSTKVIQTYDPVFSFMVSKKMNKETINVFTIIPRHNSGDMFVQEAIKLYTEKYSGHPINILLMQPNNPGEHEAALKLRSALGGQTPVIAIGNVEDLMKLMARSSHVIVQRFHGALAALAADVPLTIIPQGEGDKLAELQRYCSSDTCDIGELLKLAQDGEDALKQALRL